jgi:hypothetical protein
MATTTTNFGWDIPQSTDLVKDGATAIAALGQDIDTALVDLKGGTTGQVLAKASGTDLDYSWVTTDDANAIQNSIVDAKGDLISATANDTPARLAVGNDGETLVADSSTSTGLRYQGSMAAGRNIVINGGFDIWQRGTSSTTNNAYGADRWYQNIAAGSLTWSQETSIVPIGSRYSMKVLSGAAGSGTFVIQAVETANAATLAGKTVTVSAQCSSSASTNWGIYLSYSTSTDVGLSGSWTDITPSSGSISTTTSTTFISNFNVFAIPSTAKSLRVMIYPNAMASGTAAYFGNVQLAEGSVATTFTRAGGTIQGELSACQRYYYRFTGDGLYQNYGFGMAQIATSARIWVFNPVTMRVKPTSLDFGNLTLSQIDAAYAVTALTIQTDTSGKNGVSLTATVASGLTTYRSYFLYNDNNTAGYLGLSAEL